MKLRRLTKLMFLVRLYRLESSVSVVVNGNYHSNLLCHELLQLPRSSVRIVFMHPAPTLGCYLLADVHDSAHRQFIFCWPSLDLVFALPLPTTFLK